MWRCLQGGAQWAVSSSNCIVQEEFMYERSICAAGWLYGRLECWLNAKNVFVFKLVFKDVTHDDVGSLVEHAVRFTIIPPTLSLWGVERGGGDIIFFFLKHLVMVYFRNQKWIKIMRLLSVVQIRSHVFLMEQRCSQLDAPRKRCRNETDKWRSYCSCAFRQIPVNHVMALKISTRVGRGGWEFISFKKILCKYHHHIII